MVPKSTQLTVLKLSIAAILTAWCCVWILKPTQLWKRSWHKAEDWADSNALGESGINVIVFCFPVLAVALLECIYLHLCAREGEFRRKAPRFIKLSNPIIASPIGIVSTSELIAAFLFMIFLAWTCYSNVASDLKRMRPSKSLPLNRQQLKVMYVGVRLGSLSEACIALLLLPVLRGMSLLKICGIQFEASVRYHIWLGNLIMLFSFLHGTVIMCVWRSQNILWFEVTRWQMTGRVYLAGLITLTTGVIIWITSLPPLRRKNFQFFYFSHHLYVIFIVFFLLHAGAGHFYLVFSGVLLFALDKILRIIQSRKTIRLISAHILPCKAIELTIPKDHCMQYTPMSTLFVKIPSISKFQWHPFSITSSSKMEDDRLSLIIKCQGPWTNSLFHLVQSIDDGRTNDMRSLDVAVEGPYGPQNCSYKRYNSLILIAGGSGITPFLSILQDAAASRNATMDNCCTNIQLIYAVKKSEDVSMLAPVSSLLLNQQADLGIHIRLRLFVTQELKEEAQNTSVTKMLQEMSQLKTIVINQGSNGDGIQEPEGLLMKAAIIGLASIIFLVALVSLTHVFIHKERGGSQKKAPSWISDILVVCSFVVAASVSFMTPAFVSLWKKPLKERGNVKGMESSLINSDKSIHDVMGQHEIYFGQRPNLEDILIEHSTKAGESKVAVFVCGPYSMQASVASYSKKHSDIFSQKNKCSWSFNSINFSL